MVCIIDDREDVWNFAPNLIHVKPYRFFQGTADINAPPGLSKTEQDSEPLVHRVRRVSQSSTNSTDSKEMDKNENTKLPSEEEMKEHERIRLRSVTEQTADVGEEEQVKSDTENKEDVKSEDQTKDGTVENEKKQTESTDKASDSSEQKSSGNECDEDKENVPGKEETDEKEVQKSTESENKYQSDSKSDTKANEDEKKDNKEESKEEDLIVWDDEDDYLFYLKEILENIHSTFYDMIDQSKGKGEAPKDSDKPNLKNIIPYMKKKVLKGCNIVFSGVIPTNMAQEKSRAFNVAKALGANIQKDLVTKENEKDSKQFTTHLVAARLGTSKVRSALKSKKVCIVTAEWLWSCAERWEKVEEGLFPLTTVSDERSCDSPDVTEMAKKKDGKRKLPSDDSPDRKEKRAKTEEKEKEFSYSYNPLYAFSDDDLAYMDKEVDDEMDSEGDESSEDDEDRDKRLREEVLKKDSEEDSSSQDSLSGNRPRGWKLKRKMSPKSSSSEDESPKTSSPHGELGPEYESETDQDKFDKIMDAFGPDSEMSDNDEEYEESIGSVDDEMADAVEKEFLS